MAKTIGKVLIAETLFDIDLQGQRFRNTVHPGQTIAFDSAWGTRLCHRFGIVQCSECGAYSRPRSLREMVRCPQCQLLFVPAELV